MSDVIFLLTIVGFFLLCALYVKGCDRIIGGEAELEVVSESDLDGEGIPTPVRRPQQGQAA